MSVFNEYARYYDLLYRDKDYRGEADYVHRLIQQHRPGAKTILNLGCGSGRHDRSLAERGYKIVGIDISEEMLTAARKAANNGESPEYLLGDIRSFRSEQRFDAVIALFHVMSYQSTNEDLLAAFKTAHVHLKQDGLFLFDCWYGPGVLTDRPVVRVKSLEDKSLKITRIANPVMNASSNLVDVNYQIFIENRESKHIAEIRETHRMRYLFEPEVRELLAQAGFTTTSAEEWLSSAPLDFTSWSAVFASKKDEHT